MGQVVCGGIDGTRWHPLLAEGAGPGARVESMVSMVHGGIPSCSAQRAWSQVGQCGIDGTGRGALCTEEEEVGAVGVDGIDGTALLCGGRGARGLR